MMGKEIMPKLRFSEFKEKWSSNTLNDISDDVGYGIGSAATIFDGEHKYLRITDIDEVSNSFVPSPLTSPKGKIGKKYFLKEGDIVFARTGASVGKTYIYDSVDGNIVFAGFLIRFSITSAVPKFVFYSTLTSKYNKWVQVMSMRSGQPGLNAEELKSYSIELPSLLEQQKIASFLTAVDDKITKLTKKKALLEQYKKGVIQQLFSQEIRFRDDEGGDYPEWENKRLKEFILDFIVPMRDKPKDLTGEIPWCRIEDFEGKYLAKSKTNQGVTEKVVRQMNLKVYPVNTLLVSCSANLGFCAIVQKELITNQTFIGLFPDLNRIDVDFLYHIMKLSSRRLNILSSGTTISYLSRKQFENFKIQYPCVEEQIKIASFLSAIDDKISQVGSQVEKTAAFKKGLLQQMLV